MRLRQKPAKCILVCLDASFEGACHGRELLPRQFGVLTAGLRRDFGVLTVSVQAKKGLVTKKDRRAFSSAL